ncbi:MAG TPA: transposase [Pirellulaceae bacterium]|nr:transposase [Pirellulaceae bacterium]
MPRTSRASKGGYVYHAPNRGNGRNDVFHKPDDFAAFVRLMRESHDHVPMRLTGYCLLNNHFHLLLWSYNDGDLSRWMQWLTTSHVRRYHRHYGGSVGARIIATPSRTTSEEATRSFWSACDLSPLWPLARFRRAFGIGATRREAARRPAPAAGR